MRNNSMWNQITYTSMHILYQWHHFNIRYSNLYNVFDIDHIDNTQADLNICHHNAIMKLNYTPIDICWNTYNQGTSHDTGTNNVYDTLERMHEQHPPPNYSFLCQRSQRNSIKYIEDYQILSWNNIYPDRKIRMSLQNCSLIFTTSCIQNLEFDMGIQCIISLTANCSDGWGEAIAFISIYGC